MNFTEKYKNENDAYLQLLMIVGYALAGIFVFIILAFAVVFALYGMEVFKDPAFLSFSDLKYRPALYILLFAQSAGLFLVPAYFLSLTEGKRLNTFYGLKTPRALFLLLVILVMIASMPLMEWVTLWNQKMALPEFLKGVERWMRLKEDEMAQTTLLLLKMSGIKDFIVNLFFIAFVAAVSEEFLFRGALQRTFTRLFKNPHIAIWVSAFIFSAIHIQFYGFLPRFLLGAGFGYLYLWSGNLWYSILGHFINNGIAVTQAWYMQKNNLPLTNDDGDAFFAWYGYVISFILTAILFLYFKQKSTERNEQ